ncbi:conserved hypothetical protein [Ricinus communis]|uniref:Uncharacterized protein n=1 Tax=Ricinus communis TaxID=3988 RepID=B9T3L4_RICCO|nr:conserved hypothetical protein [Ricinus communis]
MHMLARVRTQVLKGLLFKRWFCWVREQATTIKNIICREGEGFVKVERVKVPDTSIAALMNTSLSRADCEQCA